MNLPMIAIDLKREHAELLGTIFMEKNLQIEIYTVNNVSKSSSEFLFT